MTMTSVKASNVATKGFVSKQRNTFPTVLPETEAAAATSFLIFRLLESKALALAVAPTVVFG